MTPKEELLRLLYANSSKPVSPPNNGTPVTADRFGEVLAFLAERHDSLVNLIDTRFNEVEKIMAIRASQHAELRSAVERTALEQDKNFRWVLGGAIAFLAQLVLTAIAFLRH